LDKPSASTNPFLRTRHLALVAVVAVVAVVDKRLLLL
jgi:hypothetical protein